ncbi:cytochrome P450 family protein [Senna tora]|uniref:Cytochrome P450 family protein n=1 Tax=Senna tora TaxID=362788 RepID=A0A834TVN6_9FABA|nr:cytochrome P450 family protein [Senna tora]
MIAMKGKSISLHVYGPNPNAEGPSPQGPQDHTATAGEEHFPLHFQPSTCTTPSPPPTTTASPLSRATPPPTSPPSLAAAAFVVTAGKGVVKSLIVQSDKLFSAIVLRLSKIRKMVNFLIEVLVLFVQSYYGMIMVILFSIGVTNFASKAWKISSNQKDDILVPLPLLPPLTITINSTLSLPNAASPPSLPSTCTTPSPPPTTTASPLSRATPPPTSPPSLAAAAFVVTAGKGVVKSLIVQSDKLFSAIVLRLSKTRKMVNFLIEVLVLFVQSYYGMIMVILFSIGVTNFASKAWKISSNQKDDILGRLGIPLV